MTTQLTLREREILDYVAVNGGFAVQMSARNVRQNKNFYSRVHKLEMMDLIQVVRVQGSASYFNLTKEGRQVVLQKGTDPQLGFLTPDLPDHEIRELKDLVEKSNMEPWVKHRVLQLIH